MLCLDVCGRGRGAPDPLNACHGLCARARGGAGELLDSLFGPRASGLGRLLVGAAILLAFVILLLAQRSKEKSP
jgi:hypothetical protein